MVELVAAVRGDVKIFEAVIIVIADRDAHAVTNTLQAGFFGHVFESAIGFLVVKAIPVTRAGLLRDSALGSRVLEGRAIHQENVEAAVVVVVEKRDAATHGFEQVVPGRMRREVIEVDGEGGCNVSEFPWQWLR